MNEKLKLAAKDTRAIYDEYIIAGFTPDQAFELVLSLIKNNKR